VRSPEEVEAMEAVSAIKGGIRVGKTKLPAEAAAASAAAEGDALDSREPALAGKP
jgi:hypothetical protein